MSWYIAWYIPYGIYHGICYDICHFCMVYTMVYNHDTCHMVYTIWYIPTVVWYIPSKSGIYHEATFPVPDVGRADKKPSHFIIPLTATFSIDVVYGSVMVTSESEGCVKVFPNMFTVSNSPTVVFDCCDAQLQLKTRKKGPFFESQLVAIGPEELRVLHCSEV
jgi:hypothetical protein